MAVVRKRRWTEGEHLMLEQMVDSGVSEADMARILDRSVLAIRSKRFTRDLRIRLPWTPKDEQQLRDFVAVGLSLTQISRRTGRSVQAIRRAIDRLNLRREPTTLEEAGYILPDHLKPLYQRLLEDGLEPIEIAEHIGLQRITAQRKVPKP